MLEDSYIIITSDHGEHLGGKLDHYLWEHNTYQSIYEPLIKVPLLIYNKKFKKRLVYQNVVKPNHSSRSITDVVQKD